jgi:signal transduction histidine kinase
MLPLRGERVMLLVANTAKRAASEFARVSDIVRTDVTAGVLLARAQATSAVRTVADRVREAVLAGQCTLPEGIAAVVLEALGTHGALVLASDDNGELALVHAAGLPRKRVQAVAGEAGNPVWDEVRQNECAWLFLDADRMHLICPYHSAEPGPGLAYWLNDGARSVVGCLGVLALLDPQAVLELDSDPLHETARQLQQLRTIHELGGKGILAEALIRLNGAGNRDDRTALIETLTREALRLVPCDAASLLLRDPGDTWEVAAASQAGAGSNDASAPQGAFGQSFPVGASGMLQSVVKTQRSLVCNDARELARCEQKAAYPELRNAVPIAVAIAPLIVATPAGQHVLGALRLATRSVPDPVTGSAFRFSVSRLAAIMPLVQTAATDLVSIDLRRGHDTRLTEAEQLVKTLQAEIENRERSLMSLRHELLAPLEPIVQRLELLRQELEIDHVLTKKRALTIRDMTNEAFHVRYVIDGVQLLFDEGVKPRKVEGYFFEDVVLPIAQMLGAHAVSRGIRIKVDGVKELPPIWYDIGMAKELVYNLLSNALKYSSDKTDIWVRVRRDGDSFALLFQNRGIGVPAGWELRIFERWVIGPNAAEQKLGGSGLGLAIAREIAGRHGWTLALTSRDSPTEFRLEIL